MPIPNETFEESSDAKQLSAEVSKGWSTVLYTSYNKNDNLMPY